jgi:hypothetical protein
MTDDGPQAGLPTLPRAVACVRLRRTVSERRAAGAWVDASWRPVIRASRRATSSSATLCSGPYPSTSRMVRTRFLDRVLMDAQTLRGATWTGVLLQVDAKGGGQAHGVVVPRGKWAQLGGDELPREIEVHAGHRGQHNVRVARDGAGSAPVEAGDAPGVHRFAMAGAEALDTRSRGAQGDEPGAGDAESPSEPTTATQAKPPAAAKSMAPMAALPPRVTRQPPTEAAASPRRLAELVGIEGRPDAKPGTSRWPLSASRRPASASTAPAMSGRSGARVRARCGVSALTAAHYRA